MLTFTRVFVPVAIFTLLGTGCGVPKEKHQRTLDELRACQDEASGCKTARGQAETQLAKLNADLSATRSESENTAATAAGLQRNLKSTLEELDELRRQRAEAEKRLQAFKELTAKFQQMIDTGKLKVAVRGGRMILELPAGILFASGKADLSKEGTMALTEVGIILKDFADRRFLVAGHTDNLPLRNAKYKDNWELATARALTVTKFLITSGMDPKNLGAAGYAEFDPTGDNTTEEGRQLNRRIELILVPNISELPGMPGETTKS